MENQILGTSRHRRELSLEGPRNFLISTRRGRHAREREGLAPVLRRVAAGLEDAARQQEQRGAERDPVPDEF